MPKYSCDMGDPIDMLAEECGETIQALMKSKRFGMDGAKLDGYAGPTPKEQIVTEIGDIMATVAVLVKRGYFTADEIDDAADRKLDKLYRYFGYVHDEETTS